MNIKILGTLVKERLLQDKDLVIAVTGAEGDGKSALALGLGLEIDPLFSMERNILYSPTVKEATEKIYSLQKFSVILVDEAIKIMYKLNWGTKLTKYLNVIYGICRKQNLLSVLCMPRFTDFTEYFRNHRIKIWIHIFDPISSNKKNGIAAIMMRTWNPISPDPWGLKDAEKMYVKVKRGNYSSLSGLKESYFRRLDCFVGFLNFQWIPEKEWAEYLELKNKYSIPDDIETREELENKELIKWKNRTLILLKSIILLGVKMPLLERLLKVDKQTIKKWFKETAKIPRLD